MGVNDKHEDGRAIKGGLHLIDFLSGGRENL